MLQKVIRDFYDRKHEQLPDASFESCFPAQELLCLDQSSIQEKIGVREERPFQRVIYDR